MSRRWTIMAVAGAAAALAVAQATMASAALPDGSRGVRFAHVCNQTVAAGQATCFALLRTDVGASAATAGADATPLATVSGYGPADLRSAYKLPATGGSGRTIAIVDAFDLPTAAADLNTYRSQFGLPAVNVSGGPTFRKVSQTGSTTRLPRANSSWGQEIALDIDMASAVCGSCNILLVEASSASLSNLGTAVNFAASQTGVAAISNSYGGADQAASSAYNHAGIAITASTGDDGFGVSYPASDAHVTAVGGTTLKTSSTTRGWTETVWSGAGSGCSTHIAKPSFQTNVSTGCSNRAVADVSAVADPATGVAVFDSTANAGKSGWLVFGGTSVASPVVASIYALAGTGLSNATPYSNTGSLFDVTSGSNGSCSPAVLCTAGTGWDGPTGLGTPNGLGAF